MHYFWHRLPRWPKRLHLCKSARAFGFGIIARRRVNGLRVQSFNSHPISILLNADHQFSPTAIARGSVSTFEVANGRKSRALVGAGAGFLIGSMVGLLIGAAVDPPDPNAFLDFGGGPAGFVVGALLGTVFGAAIGAGAGAERWVAVGGEQAQIGLGPAPRGGWAFGGAFRF